MQRSHQGFVFRAREENDCVKIILFSDISIIIIVNTFSKDQFLKQLCHKWPQSLELVFKWIKLLSIKSHFLLTLQSASYQFSTKLNFYNISTNSRENEVTPNDAKSSLTNFKNVSGAHLSDACCLDAHLFFFGFRRSTYHPIPQQANSMFDRKHGTRMTSLGQYLRNKRDWRQPLLGHFSKWDTGGRTEHTCHCRSHSTGQPGNLLILRRNRNQLMWKNLQRYTPN